MAKQLSVRSRMITKDFFKALVFLRVPGFRAFGRVFGGVDLSVGCGDLPNNKANT